MQRKIQPKTQIFNKVHFFPVTSSTNDEALKRIQEGGEEGEIFIAESQTAGRGQMGRIWESPAGKNLYLSFLLKPKLSPSQALLLTLVAGAATFDALKQIVPASFMTGLKIKWPNDLTLQERKIAGILTEMKTEGDSVRWVICGVGININAEAGDFSPEVRKMATSIKIATEKAVDPEVITIKLIEAFETRYLEFLKKGASDLIDFCNHHSYLNGKRVRVENAPRPLRGLAVGLNSEGHLMIKTDGGTTESVLSGDVVTESS